MPRSSRRLEPRHLDPERLRLTAPSRPASMAAVGVALVLAVLGVAVFSGGAVGRGSAALKSDPAAAEARIRPPRTRPTRRRGRVTRAAPPAATGSSRRTGSSPRRSREPAQPRRAGRACARGHALDRRLRGRDAQHPRQPAHRGWPAVATPRAPAAPTRATQMLLGRGSSIIGFSEIQGDQLGVFTNNAPSYDVYPGTSLGSAGIPTTRRLGHRRVAARGGQRPSRSRSAASTARRRS